MSTNPSTLTRARAGDEAAFRALTDPYRRELQLHCYRILGSVQDAEDVLQETLLAAWRSLGGFEERASLRSWLYRIATNRCLNALRDAGRRPRLALELPEPTRWTEPLWLQPYPDDLLAAVPDEAPGPDARYETREATALAFVTALQHLPARQRAVIVLRDVLGYRETEVAAILESSDASVKGALQRARATLAARLPAGGREEAPLPESPRERELVSRFADAVESGDLDELVTLLTDDAEVMMPPEPHVYVGGTAIKAFLQGRSAHRGGELRLLPTRANGQPAFGAYFAPPGTTPARPRGVMVLTLAGARIAAITFFSEPELFRRFGLPETL